MPLRLALVGSGSLARATGVALSTVEGLAAPLDLVVLARDGEAAADLCDVAQVRATLCGRRLRASAVPVDPTDATAVAGVLAAAEPDGVAVCASTQSPWEHADRPSAWTALLRRAGFGLTLPFQAQVPLAVVRAHATAFVVNACYPDAVNPLLAALGVPVLAGAGNVALLGAALQAALDLPDQGRLRVLGHHLHLRVPDARDEAPAWLDGAPVTGVADHLARLRAGNRRARNDITGLLTAQPVADLLTGATRDTHLPGVAGLPGGYPVRVSAGAVALRLPPGIDEDEAVRMNQRWAGRDGVVVADGRVRFGPAVSNALAPVAPELAEGFAVSDLGEATAALAAVRERLRARPVTG